MKRRKNKKSVLSIIKIDNNKAIVAREDRDVSGKLIANVNIDGVKQSKEIEVTVKGQSTNKISAVDFTKVKVTDKFFAARQKQVICSILKVGIEKVEAKDGGFNNFVEAAKKNKGENAKAFEGDVYFLDSDAYKMIEAMSYGLQIDSNGDVEIEEAKKDIIETLNKWIPYIEGAQEEDGYLDTFFTLDSGTQNMSATTAEKKKWTDFAAHELYVDGHFYEAAVALYRANGDTRLLDVAIKNADLVNSIFGEGGTKKATSGHQEIELALLKLAAACQEAQADEAQRTYKGLYGQKSDCYVKLAKRFLDLRGDTTDRDGYYSFGANNAKYRQDHERVSKQTEAVGHVVRAMYQYIAMTDVTLLSDTYVYDNALTSLWKDITGSKMYVTGGMGVVNNDESFGSSYQLPVNGAYSETCGSIGSVMWNQRMNMLYGDKKYIDVMETTLYNAVISGVNFDGDKFFYQNPISSDGSVERSAWFGCACCPPNLMRLINSLGGYLYTQDENGININLYMGNEANIRVKDTNVKLTEEANIPWDGNIKMSVAPEKESAFALRFRVPDWCQGNYKVKVNDKEMDVTINDKGYLLIDRTWKMGDTVEIVFGMNIIRTHQSDKVSDTKGYTAVKKGPVVYVAESADNDFDINLFTLPSEQALAEVYTDNLTGGKDPYGIKGGLKITGVGKLQTIKGSKEQKITVIPYYAWNNRGKGIMRTYIKE